MRHERTRQEAGRRDGMECPTMREIIEEDEDSHTVAVSRIAQGGSRILVDEGWARRGEEGTSLRGGECDRKMTWQRCAWQIACALMATVTCV